MTVAEIMALDKEAREPAIARMLAEQFPKPMVDRAVDEIVAGVKAGETGDAVLSRIVPRLYGFLEQIDPGLADVPPAMRETFTWALVKVFLQLVIDRVPPGGGGRRVAA